MEISAKAYEEVFLQANANREFIAHTMAQVLRDLLRSVSSDNDTGMAAAENMDSVCKLITRCQQPISWWHVFSDAIELIRSNIRADEYERDYVHVAKRGIKFFVESSAVDDAARGRAAKRLNEFRDAIGYIEEAASDRSSPTDERIHDRLLKLSAPKVGNRK